MRAWPKIMRGFEQPPKLPRPHTAEQLEDQSWRDYVYRAVHGADPEFRAYFAELVGQHLLSGGPVPEPVREWLAFVLGTLLQSGAIPTLHAGRPARASKRLLDTSTLMRAMSNRRKKHPTENVTTALLEVAGSLDWSYAKARSIYYSKACRVHREMVSK